MPEHKPVEPLEVGDGVVTELSCLVSFLAHDADTNVRGLNHVDIVTTVTDGQGVGFIVEPLNEFNH